MDHRAGSTTRRKFVQGVGTVGLALVAGCGRLPWQAQPPRTARIGVLKPYDADAAWEQALREGLRDHGYVEDQTILIERRSSGNRDELLPGLAQDLVRLPVDVIAANSTVAVAAAKRASSTIPIVMTDVSDPIGSGFIASYARPGGNITGLTNLSPELSAKRLELLNEAVAGTSRVAVVWNPERPGPVVAYRETERAAQVLGIVLQSLEVHSGDDIPPALDTAVREQADAVLVLADPLTGPYAAEIAALTLSRKLPAMHGNRGSGFLAAGGLMAYGPCQDAAYRRAAYYVDRILKGAKPADLPVEQPREFDFVINLRTAQALGLTIPPQVLLHATEVIQ